MQNYLRRELRLKVRMIINAGPQSPFPMPPSDNNGHGIEGEEHLKDYLYQYNIPKNKIKHHNNRTILC